MQAEQTATVNELNGIDTTALAETVEVIREEPEVGTMRFLAANKWINGGANQTRIDEHYVACETHKREQPFTVRLDEPAALLGTDTGPNPMETVLAALAGCLTTTLVYHAALRGIRIRAVESSYEGDASLEGFLGLSETVRNGFSDIRVKMRVEADADEKQIRELIELAQNRSGVFDTLSNPVPVRVEVAQA